MAAKKGTVRQRRSETSYWRAGILKTAARLDLFDFLGAARKTAAALAAHYGGVPGDWEIFLNALCGMGLLRERRRIYRKSSLGALQRAKRAILRLCPGGGGLGRWSGLAAILTSGKRPGGQVPFTTDRKQAEKLLQSLARDAREIAPYLLKKLPLENSRKLLDVGGGLGTYSIAFCQRYPDLKATVIEHPKIAPLARRAIRAAGMAKRVRVVSADFEREKLPRGFDVALLSNVLHAHGARENRSLLRTLRRSLDPRGRLIVRDVFMHRGSTAPEWGALFSVWLLLNSPRGRCYVLDEIRRWLDDAGFKQEKGPFRSSPLRFDPDSILLARAE